MTSRQLSLPLDNMSRIFVPLPYPIVCEIRALRALRLPCMQDIDRQKSRARINIFLLRRRIDRELHAWRKEGMPGLDEERDARLSALNADVRRLEQSLDHLEEARKQRQRLTYLEESAS